MTEDTSPERWWKNESARLRSVWLWAAWSDCFLPGYIIVCVGFGAELARLRFTGDSAGPPHWLGFALLLVCVGAVAFAFGARKSLRERSALARLDDDHELDGRLLAADAGLVSWPEPPRGGSGAGARLRSRRILAQLFAGVAVIAVSKLAPRAGSSLEAVDPAGEPLVFHELDEWTARLEDSRVIEPEEIDRLRESLEQLRSQSPETWFQDSTLEGAEHLRDELSRKTGDLREQMRELDDALSQSRGPSEEKRSDATRRTEEALGKLGKSNPRLSKELLDRLEKEFRDGGSDAKDGNAREESARERLKRGIEILRDRNQGKMGDSSGAPGESEKKPGDGSESPDGPGDGQGGRGGVQRGPGSAPLVIRSKPAPLLLLKSEPLPEGGDDSTLGDTLEERGRSPRVEEPDASPGAAGSVRGDGSGGEHVPLDGLTPDEQSVVKDYFR